MKAALWYNQKDVRIEDVQEPQVKDDTVKEGFGTLTGPDKKAQVKIIVTPDKSLL